MKFHYAEVQSAKEFVRTRCPARTFLKEGTRVDQRNMAYALDSAGAAKCARAGTTASDTTGVGSSIRIVLAKSSNAAQWEDWAKRIGVKYSLRSALSEAMFQADPTELKAYVKENVGAFAIKQVGNGLGGLMFEGATLGTFSIAGLTVSVAPMTAAAVILGALKLTYAQTCAGKFEKKRQELLSKYYRKTKGEIAYMWHYQGSRVIEEVDVQLDTPEGVISIPFSGASTEVVIK